MGVDWDINIHAPTEEPKKADSILERMEQHLKAIDAATQRVAGHFGQMGKQSKHTAEGFKGVGKTIDEVKEKFHHFAEFTGAMLVVDALEKITEKAIELGKEMVNNAAEGQRLGRIFSSAAGSSELGKQNQEWTELLAKRTELTDMETASSFLGLKRTGASDQEAKLQSKAAADIAAVSVNKSEAFAATISAFERINRTGVVSNRALAPLGIGVKDFKGLDSMKGLSDKQIKKRMEEGKVDKNDLFRLIMSRTGEKGIGEKAAGNADLLTTKLSKLTELPERFFKKLGEGKGVTVLSGAIDRMLEKLDPDGPTGKRILGGLESVFESAAAAVDSIDFDELGDVISEDVIPAIKAMTGMLQPTLEAVERIVRGFARIHDFMADAQSPVDRSKVDPADVFRAGDTGAGRHALQAALKHGRAIGDGLAAGINSGSAAAQGAAESMADKVVEVPKKKLKIKSPSVVFEDIGAMTAAGFVAGIDRATPDVDRAIQSAFSMKGSQIQGGGRGGMMGGIVMTFGDLYFNVPNGGQPEENGRRMANAFKKEIRSELFSLLEQMQIEAGA